MKKILSILLLLLLMPCLALAAAASRAAQKAQIDALLPTNGAGQITAEKLRTVAKAGVDSAYNPIDDGTPAASAHTHTLSQITNAGNAAGKDVGTGSTNVAAGDAPATAQAAAIAAAATDATTKAAAAQAAAIAASQPLDGDLTALAALSGTGVFYYRSAANTYLPVTIGGNLTFALGTLDAVAQAASDVAFGSSWDTVLLPPSKNTVYDALHAFDSDDDGKVNILDMGAGIPLTDSNGNITGAAAAGTDFAAPATYGSLASLTLPFGPANYPRREVTWSSAAPPTLVFSSATTAGNGYVIDATFSNSTTVTMPAVYRNGASATITSYAYPAGRYYLRFKVRANASTVDLDDTAFVAADLQVAGTATNYTAATPDAEAHFTGINTAIGTKLPSSYLDTDGTLAANSDTKVASQKATKTYADTKMLASYLDTDGTAAANSDTKVASQKAMVTYVGTHGGNGGYLTQNILSATKSSPTANTTYYVGSLAGVSANATEGQCKLYIPKTGTITKIYINSYAAGTAGSNENQSMYFRLNATTDTLIQTVGASTAVRTFSNTGLTISVTAGDTYEIKWTTPSTWATPSTNVNIGGIVYIE